MFAYFAHCTPAATPDSQKHETHFIFKFVVFFSALRFLGSCLRIFLHDTCELRWRMGLLLLLLLVL